MASVTQVLEFIHENDCSKNRRVFRQLQDKLNSFGSVSDDELQDEFEMKIIMPYYRACLRRNFHEFKITLHGFKCICATNAPIEEVAGAVIFFHGLGASPYAFLRVFDNFYAHYGASVPVAFILPQAPLEMHPEELGADATCSFGSYKWWDIIDPSWTSTQWFGKKYDTKDRADQEYPSPTIQTEVSDHLTAPRRKCASDVPSGLLKLRPLVEGLRQTVSQRFRIPYKHIAIAGFSQGAMLAADTHFAGSEPPLAVGIFSGAPLCLKQWAKTVSQWEADDKASAFRGVPILQTHGTKDSVLPFKAGRILRKAFRTHNMHHRMAVFPGDHFLPDTVINLFASIVITRLRYLMTSTLPLYMEPLKSSRSTTRSTETTDSKSCDVDSGETARVIESYLGPAPEVVELLKLEDDVDFLGYFEKQPIRHFYGGSENATPVANITSNDDLDKLRSRRQRRRQRLAAEFGFPDSDEKLCETSDSLAIRSESDISLNQGKSIKINRWKCISRIVEQEDENQDLSGLSETDNLIRQNREKDLVRKRLKRQKRFLDEGDSYLTFGNKSGYKISYGFLRCCLPVASHCIE